MRYKSRAAIIIIYVYFSCCVLYVFGESLTSLCYLNFKRKINNNILHIVCIREKKKPFTRNSHRSMYICTREFIISDVRRRSGVCVCVFVYVTLQNNKKIIHIILWWYIKYMCVCVCTVIYKLIYLSGIYTQYSIRKPII